MGYRKLSARPRHHAQAEGAIEDFKKNFPSVWTRSRARKESPHKRESRRGRIPEEPLVLYEGGNSDALFSGEVLFFLDFLIVGLSPGEGLVTSPEVSVLRLVRLVVWQSE